MWLLSTLDTENLDADKLLWMGMAPKQKEMAFPYLKFSKGKITLTTKNEDGENTEEELKELVAIPLIMPTHYQVSNNGNRDDWSIIAWTNEFIDSEEMVIFDHVNKRVVTGAKNKKDVEKMAEVSFDDFKIERRSVLYLYTEEYGVLRCYLKLSQTVGFVDWSYDFKNPIKGGVEATMKKDGKDFCHSRYKISIKGNKETMETFYPVFSDPKPYEGNDHKNAVLEVVKNIKEEAFAKYEKYLDSKFTLQQVVDGIEEPEGTNVVDIEDEVF